ncbi:MAG: hypothetical protein OEW89_01480 [Gammaproteobacteria bacterium]|nr:hypothetical protein [Gammaproteobacteria bacterium]
MSKKKAKRAGKKKGIASRRASRRSATAKKVTKKTAARKKKVPKKPAGYSSTESGLLIPDSEATLVPASKLRSGFKKARKEIDSIVDEIVSTMTDEYVISEIELSASFSADGKFMGFGVGGAATIKIKITPDK